MNRVPESGNVLFYIFLGVALFGALNFAVSQSGRENVSQVTNERDRLAAVELIDYSETIAQAVNTLRLRNIPLKDLRFSHPDLSAADYDAALVAPTTTQPPENLVFSPDGGGALYHAAPNEATNTRDTDYIFLAGNAVQGIGTTCASAGCADLIMAVPDMRGGVCAAVNRLASNTGPGDIIPVNPTFDAVARFKGTMAAAQIIAAAALVGKTYGCVENDVDDQRYFFRVLWAQ